MLSALFECLELDINSGCVTRLSRLAKDRYIRRRRFREPGTAALWKVGNGTVRLEEESTSGEEFDNDGTGAQPDEPAWSIRRQRRGLALGDSMQRTNFLWLPRDMFDWDTLRFRPDVLRETAFVTGYFRSQFGRHAPVLLDARFQAFVADTIAIYPTLTGDDTSTLVKERIFQPLWQLCLFRYCQWLLTHLNRAGHLPNYYNPAVSEAERRGCYGLSYGLIRRMLGEEPNITACRQGGGRGKGATTGFSHFKTDWKTRIELLFAEPAKFPCTWSHPGRQWARYCYRRLFELTHDFDLPDRWLAGLGRYARPYLTILPKYEMGKAFQLAPKRRRAGAATPDRQPLQWIAAQPNALEHQLRSPDVRPGDVPWQIYRQPHLTPLWLPRALRDFPHVMNGQPFDLIAEISGADAADEGAIEREESAQLR